MNKVHKIIIFLLYFFTIGFIAYHEINKDTDTSVMITGAFIISLVYIFSYILAGLINRKKHKIHISLNIIVLLYVLYSIFLTILIDKSNMLYTITIIIAPVVFILLINDFRDNKLYKETRIFIIYIFIIVSILSIILYLSGNSQIFISKTGFTFISSQQYLDTFGEKRLSWMMSHKSRFALFCTLGVGLVLSEDRFSFIKKILFSLILLINIFLSDSMTSVAVTSLIVLYYFYGTIRKRINKYLIIPFTLIALSVILLFSYRYLYTLNDKRNVSTLGSRTIIWELAVDKIKSNPLGIVKISQNDYLSEDTNSVIYSNGHNVFLNEAIARGIIGGILYLLIFIDLLKHFYNTKQRFKFILLLGIIIEACMDATINTEMLYCFWYCMSILYFDNTLKQKDIYENKKLQKVN